MLKTFCPRLRLADFSMQSRKKPQENTLLVQKTFYSRALSTHVVFASRLHLQGSLSFDRIFALFLLFSVFPRRLAVATCDSSFAGSSPALLRRHFLFYLSRSTSTFSVSSLGFRGLIAKKRLRRLRSLELLLFDYPLTPAF